MWTNNLKWEKNRQISIGFAIDKGNRRERNEDSIWFATDGAETICAVADGVGGCQGGEVASAAAVNAAERYWKNSLGIFRLREIFNEAHAEIREYMLNTNTKSGTTLSVLYCDHSTFSVAHAGDSRVYRVSKGAFAKIELLTRDDTWVAEKIRDGTITLREAAGHPKRHTLTNCLGGFKRFNIFETSGKIGFNDVFLLCSDGLYSYIEEPELKQILLRCVNTQQTADKLMQLALSRGGKDNISVIVLKFDA